MHADPTGFMTVQLLLVATEMPAPDSVILMPALGPAGMDCMGVNETVAVVSDAALLDARETVRFGISSSAWTGGASSANAAKNMATACMGTRRHDEAYDYPLGLPRFKVACSALLSMHARESLQHALQPIWINYLRPLSLCNCAHLQGSNCAELTARPWVLGQLHPSARPFGFDWDATCRSYPQPPQAAKAQEHTFFW